MVIFEDLNMAKYTNILRVNLQCKSKIALSGTIIKEECT